MWVLCLAIYKGLPPFLWKMCQYFVVSAGWSPCLSPCGPLLYTFKVPPSAGSLLIRETEGFFPWVRAPQLFPIDVACDTRVIPWQATP